MSLSFILNSAPKELTLNSGYMNKSVFIVNPVMTYGDFPLPYLYLVFKSYYKEYGQHSDKWNWPLPINSVEDMSFV